MTIDGAPVTSDQGFAVLNPATGLVHAQAPDCSEGQLEGAMASAAAAFREWRSDENARRETLLAAADRLGGSIDELAAVLTAEQGKPLVEARAEVSATAAWFRYYARLEIPIETIQRDANATIEVRHRPLGVVAAITPWNYPLTLASWKMAPALMAGNTMVLKPSPFTPLSTLKMGEVLAQVLPPGVLNVVSGTDPLGALMTAHPTPRKVSFTGSIATGKRVAAAAAPDLKRMTLELGGNDPAILLNDIDPEEVAAKLFWSAFRNNGQVCTAIKRVYAPEEKYHDVVDALSSLAREAKLGDGAEEGTQLGPINNKPQLVRVIGLIADAVAAGGRIAAGGRAVAGPGYFHEPTILADVTDGTRVVDEEQFGPVLPVISYRDIDEVIDRANGTQFGLSGSVWGTDSDRAADIAARLDCGTAWVNTHLVLRPDQPFSGAKWSGLGVENGRWGYHGFTEMQVLHRLAD